MIYRVDYLLHSQSVSGGLEEVVGSHEVCR